MSHASYFAQLCEELKALAKSADVEIDAGRKVIVAVTLPPNVRADTFAADNLFGPVWGAASCPTPSLAYLGNAKLSLLFEVRRACSTAALVSAASSIATTLLGPREGPPHVCTCTASVVESRPVVFTYFMLEIDAHYRAALIAHAQTPSSTPSAQTPSNTPAATPVYDYLTTYELEELCAERPPSGADAFGRFFRPANAAAGGCPAFRLFAPEYEQQAKLLFGD